MADSTPSVVAPGFGVIVTAIFYDAQANVVALAPPGTTFAWEVDDTTAFTVYPSAAGYTAQVVAKDSVGTPATLKLTLSGAVNVTGSVNIVQQAAPPAPPPPAPPPPPPVIASIGFGIAPATTAPQV